MEDLKITSGNVTAVIRNLFGEWWQTVIKCKDNTLYFTIWKRIKVLRKSQSIGLQAFAARYRTDEVAGSVWLREKQITFSPFFCLVAWKWQAYPLGIVFQINWIDALSIDPRGRETAWRSFYITSRSSSCWCFMAISAYYGEFSTTLLALSKTLYQALETQSLRSEFVSLSLCNRDAAAFYKVFTSHSHDYHYLD